MTEKDLIIKVRNRLGVPASEGPKILTLISAGLEKLARQTANDTTKRHLLLTDRATVTSAVSNTNSDYYADLSAAVSVSGVMLDYLDHGTIYYAPNATTFTVNAGSDIGSTASANGFWDGLKVRLTTSGTLPSGVTTDTDYYLASVAFSKAAFVFKFAASRTDAFVPTPIDLTDTGSGTHTITPWEFKTVQFHTREFTDEHLPTYQVRGWLVGSKLYTNVVTGTFYLSVPFIPTLTTLPPKLDADLIDVITELYQLKSEVGDDSR